MTLAEFVQGEENLSVMLGKQRPSYEKQGIGYNSTRSTGILKSKSSLNYCFPFSTCKNCGIKGHPDKNCFKRNKNRKVWIKKNDLPATNTNGPRKIWGTKKINYFLLTGIS